jgi:hypothetical protein
MFEDIGILVAEEAEEIFRTCGAEDDYCIQTVGFDCAVFGGTNRVIFRPLSGFCLDTDYCTDNFITAFYKHYR